MVSLEPDRPPPFDWADIEGFAPHFLGRTASLDSVTESAFGTSHSFRVDDEHNRGRLEYLATRSGLRIAIVDCVWGAEQVYRVRDGEWIRFNFSISLDIMLRLAPSRAVAVSEPTWQLINNPPDGEVVEVVPANKRETWVTVCCRPQVVENIAGMSLENMPDLLQAALTSRPRESFHQVYDITSRLNSTTCDILKTTLKDATRTAFIEARAMELLCYALDHLLHRQFALPPMRLTDADRTVLREANAILLQEFSAPPTISELSKRLGMNRNKLYYGFKHLFDKPISEFVHEQRLQEGKRLLRTTDLSVAEVAERVGFRHQSNFATAMKKYFGMTPRQFRR